MMASWLVIVIVMALLQTGVVKGPARGNSGEITESEQGKKIFVARCAKCHDDDMKKKLPDGSNLFTRLSASKDPKLRLGTRLKDGQERDAVASYFFALQAASDGK